MASCIALVYDGTNEPLSIPDNIISSNTHLVVSTNGNRDASVSIGGVDDGDMSTLWEESLFSSFTFNVLLSVDCNFTNSIALGLSAITSLSVAVVSVFTAVPTNPTNDASSIMIITILAPIRLLV